MKKFIISLFFVIFALFNICGEDLLHPVIRDDIDEDIKKIELALVNYIFYPEMVERGFDVHQLDNMKIDGEMFEYVESFFRPNEEKGWLPLDNHHMFSIKDENGWHDSKIYRKWVKFSNEYGTKDELLEKGYVENETMFYYPSNGEKDWRVGEWSWFNWKDDDWKDGNSATKLNFVGMKKINDAISTLETKKSYVVTINNIIDNNTFKSIKLSKKDNLIIDILNCPGGESTEVRKFIELIKKSKFKKIIVLTDDTSSAGERLVLLLKDDKRVIYIGENTNGALEGSAPEIIISEKSKITLKLSTRDNVLDTTFLGEGIGLIPDIWVGGLGGNDIIDFMKNIWRITEDYELVTSDLDVKIECNKLMKK